VWFNGKVFPMNQETFTIVFQKLSEALAEEGESQVHSTVEASRAEIDEIDELRRMVLEVAEPEPSSYTTA
jgi:hypothetical protein